MGHGCGDSLLMLQDRAPRCLHGVTSLEAHARRAQVRTRPDTKVHCAEAVAWLAATTHTYDTILALDCAYHFADRPAFFRAAHDALAPGGTLALVDLVAAWPYADDGADDGAFHASTLPPPTRAPSYVRTGAHRLACMLTRTPAHAFVSFDTYRAQLRAAGFDAALEMHDISADVFPGFAHFLQQLGTGSERLWRGGSGLQTLALHAFGRVVAQWAHGGDVGYVRCGLIVARKRA